MKLHPENPTPGFGYPVHPSIKGEGFVFDKGFLNTPHGLNPDTKELVTLFAEALAAKLRKSELKYGYSNGWKNPNWMAECRGKLRDHLEKGDPLDVAAYCAFLWYHKEPTVKHADSCTEWTPAHPPKRPTTDEIYNKLYPGDPYERS